MAHDDIAPGESLACGETDSGIRNLPCYLASRLAPGPTLVVGASLLGLEVVAERGSSIEEVVVADADPDRLDSILRVARSRGVDARPLQLDVEREPLGLASRSFANVVCLDSLEGFKDDVGVLEKLHRVLEPDGRLIVRVRAHPWARVSRNGERGASLRAYDAESLRDALEEAAFRPVSLRHWNFLGVPGTFLNERVLRRNGDSDAASKHWWDRGIDLWFKTIENRVGFPVGVSLVAVAAPLFEKVSVANPAPGRAFAPRAPREAYEPMGMRR